MLICRCAADISISSHHIAALEYIFYACTRVVIICKWLIQRYRLSKFAEFRFPIKLPTKQSAFFFLFSSKHGECVSTPISFHGRTQHQVHRKFAHYMGNKRLTRFIISIGYMKYIFTIFYTTPNMT